MDKERPANVRNPAQRNLHLGKQLNAKLEEKAHREHRTPSEMGKLLIEWALAQLDIAGTVMELLKRTIGRGQGSVEREAEELSANLRSGSVDNERSRTVPKSGQGRSQPARTRRRTGS